MNAETWAKVRKEAVAFALTQLEGGFAHALSLAGDVFELGRLQQAIVAQDLVMKLRPTVLISQDTGLVVDHFEYSPVPGIDPHVNVVFLDWSELTPQDGNPTQMIAWLHNVQEAIGKIRSAAGIPIDQRVGDLEAIAQQLEENEPEWYHPGADEDPSDLPQPEQSEYWEWQKAAQAAQDAVALLGGAQVCQVTNCPGQGRPHADGKYPDWH